MSHKPKHKQTYPLCTWCRDYKGKKKYSWYCRRCYMKLNSKSGIVGGGA